jgi:hypothetical protein
MRRLQTIYHAVAQMIRSTPTFALIERQVRKIFLILFVGRLELIPVPVRKPQIIRRRKVSHSPLGRHNSSPNSWNGN